jgi:hypothetical protein
VLIARDEETRALRMRRLGTIEDHFDALPFDAAVARECGRLHALVAQRGGAPRRRALDLAIAATANVHGVPLLTYNTRDFQIIADKIDLRKPDAPDVEQELLASIGCGESAQLASGHGLAPTHRLEHRPPCRPVLRDCARGRCAA